MSEVDEVLRRSLRKFFQPFAELLVKQETLRTGRQNVLKNFGSVVVSFEENDELARTMLEFRESLTGYVEGTRGGFLVTSEVADLLKGSVSTPTQTSVRLHKHHLIVDANDVEVTRYFTTRNYFREVDGGKDLLKKSIVSCILNQWQGAAGILETVHSANLFYYERGDRTRFCVQVGWHHILHLWGVYLHRYTYKDQPYGKHPKGTTVFTLD